MNRKKIQVDEIMNELEGASLFFKNRTSSTSPSVESLPQPVSITAPEKSQLSNNEKTASYESNQSPGVDEIYLTTPYNEPESLPDRVHASMTASMQARIQAEKSHDLIKTIRKAVRKVGKEVLYVRLSPAEKHTLESIVYAFNDMYRGEGYKTSENEVGRIGLNYLLENYRERGEESILARVLAALLA